jgi:hypothetical protein
MNPLATVACSLSAHDLIVRADADELVVTGDLDQLADDLTATLRDHKPLMLDALGAIPPGCPVPHICMVLGICPREIENGACSSNTESEVAKERQWIDARPEPRAGNVKGREPYTGFDGQQRIMVPLTREERLRAGGYS